jgi:hypothetical protein
LKFFSREYAFSLISSNVSQLPYLTSNKEHVDNLTIFILFYLTR